MPRSLGTIGHTLESTRFGWLCRFIGHWWYDDTPDRLIHTKHRRVRCKRCRIQRYRFASMSQQEIEEVMAFGAPPTNRAERRQKA